MYFAGDGVQQDTDKAVELLKQATTAGHMDAAGVLRNFHRGGMELRC